MRARHARGMSLVELVVVIALVAAITAGLVGVVRSGSDGPKLRGAVREVVAQLRHTRAHAVLQGRTAAFALDMESRRWEAPGRRGRLPEALSIEATTADEASDRENEASIRFHPDGSSTGGVIRLAVADAEWRIEVLWLTGEVRAEQLMLAGE